MSILKILNDLKTELSPFKATLVAVSKTYGPDSIKEAFQAGQIDFGENKVQEMCDKHELLDKTIHWHQIGHLQTNKVKYLGSFVHLIHSVDSLKLLQEINKHALKNSRVIPCLLQMHIATEETKFGLNEQEAEEILHPETLQELPGIQIKGLMGMASNSEDTILVRNEFSGLRRKFETWKRLSIPGNEFDTLSMGMSSDYKIALEEGSNMVRIGSRIFGARSYTPKDI
jgi:hypothetical protein